MKELIQKFALVGAICLGTLTGVAAPTVTLSKVQQRYPWNGLVDIDYEIAGISAGETDGLQLEVRARDEMSKAEFVAVNGLQYAPPVTAGKHRVTWNTAADNAIIYSSNVTVTVTLKKPKTPPLYVVIDLSVPDTFGVNYLDAVPEGGWTDEYKTSKLVLRRIEAGQFVMGAAETNPVNPHNVTLTKPYYIGVFEVTYEQWKRVMGTSLSCSLSSDRDHTLQPVVTVTYDQIRGNEKGAKWPVSSGVDESSFLGVFRMKTGLYRFDLPTEAQWEFASKGGVDSRSGGQDVASIADTSDRFFVQTAAGYRNYYTMGYETTSVYRWGGLIGEVYPSVLKDVGVLEPNAYGLYGCLGGAAEWCLDWYNESYGENEDPLGPQTGNLRALRGGCFCDLAKIVSAVRRAGALPNAVPTQAVTVGWTPNVSYVDGYRPERVEFHIAGFRICYHGEL